MSSTTRATGEEWLSLTEPEAVLEPCLAIVDAHLHLWNYGGTRYFLEDYARDWVSCGHDVQATVFVECSTMYRANGPEHLKPVGETEFAVGMAAMAASGHYTTCRVNAGIVGFADLTLGDRARETIAAHLTAANGRFRGVRQRAKWDADPVVKGKFFADVPVSTWIRSSAAASTCWPRSACPLMRACSTPRSRTSRHLRVPIPTQASF